LKFLGRAKKFLQDLASEPPAKVQSFSVTCASGHRVRGERTEGYQALRCPACGEGVFVLPRSPLPEPVAPARAAEPRAAAAVFGEAIVEEGPVGARPTGPRRDPDTTAPAVLETRYQPRKRHRLRLIALLVPLLVVATVGWRYWNSRRQEFPLIAERGRTEGIPALDEGNFDRAYQILSAAKAAVEALGGDVADAEAIRHAAAEAAIFVDRSPRLLEDLLDEAGRTDPETWASRFDLLYKGRSILIDSWIMGAPEGGGSAGHTLAYRVFAPGEASDFLNPAAPRERYADIDLAGFELLEQTSVGDHVTFGARLAGLRYESESDKWVVRLDPKSGVFIVHTGALQAIGWPVPKEIDEPVEGQP